MLKELCDFVDVEKNSLDLWIKLQFDKGGFFHGEKDKINAGKPNCNPCFFATLPGVAVDMTQSFLAEIEPQVPQFLWINPLKQHWNPEMVKLQVLL